MDTHRALKQLESRGVSSRHFPLPLPTQAFPFTFYWTTGFLVAARLAVVGTYYN